MQNLGKDFFIGNEVLIVGYPLKPDPDMQMIMKAFLDNNIRVTAMNEDARDDAGIKLFRNFGELPGVPKTAYIYLDKKDIGPYIGQLADADVKRVLFHSKRDVDPDQLESCKKAGLEIGVACPMMLLGKGLHRFHAWLAGVR
jgi:hypothetical protein